MFSSSKLPSGEQQIEKDLGAHQDCRDSDEESENREDQDKIIVINQRTIINDRNRSLNSLKDKESDRPDDSAEYRRIREIIALNGQAGRIEESSECSGEAVCLTEVRLRREQEALYSKLPWIQQCRECTAQPIQYMNDNVVKVADQCNTWEEESVDGKVKRVPSSNPQRLPSWEQMLR